MSEFSRSLSSGSEEPVLDFAQQSHREAYGFAFHLLDEALDSRGMPINPSIQAFPMHEIIASQLVDRGFSDELATLIVDRSYQDIMDLRTIETIQMG